MVLAVPSNAYGVEAGINIVGADSGGDAESLAMLEDTGAKWARHFLHWDRFEPAKGQIDMGIVAKYKEALAKEQAIGVKTMLTVLRSPTWASGSADPYSPPRDPEDYARFIEAMAREFAGQVEVFEIWNEQDESIFWAGAVNVGQYTSILKASYPLIKAADPTIKVAFGPTTGNNYAFLEQAYAAGAKGSFDAVSVHTDTACNVSSPNEFYKDNGRIGQYPFLGYREVRASMLAAGDDKPIYMSELGWSTSKLICERGMWAGKKPAGVTELKQAANLAQAYHCLTLDPYVEIGLWFNSKDFSATEGELNRYGLRRADGSNKPSYEAFKGFATGGDRLAGECGDFSPPTVRIKSPRPNRKVFDKLVVHADTPDKDVARMTFLVDGVGVKNFTPPKGSPVGTVRDYVKLPLYLDWQGVRKLTFGMHTLTVLAKDTNGNESEQSRQFFRIDPSTLPPQTTQVQKVKLRGKGRKRIFSGKVVAPGLDFGIAGKVKATWQAKRAGKWKKVHGGAKNANKAFAFSQQLKYTGEWRVRVEFAGQKPYKKTATTWKTFTVK